MELRSKSILQLVVVMGLEYLDPKCCLGLLVELTSKPGCCASCLILNQLGLGSKCQLGPMVEPKNILKLVVGMGLEYLDPKCYLGQLVALET